MFKVYCKPTINSSNTDIHSYNIRVCIYEYAHTHTHIRAWTYIKRIKINRDNDRCKGLTNCWVSMAIYNKITTNNKYIGRTLRRGHYNVAGAKGKCSLIEKFSSASRYMQTYSYHNGWDHKGMFHVESYCFCNSLQYFLLLTLRSLHQAPLRVDNSTGHRSMIYKIVSWDWLRRFFLLIFSFRNW